MRIEISRQEILDLAAKLKSSKGKTVQLLTTDIKILGIEDA